MRCNVILAAAALASMSAFAAFKVEHPWHYTADYIENGTKSVLKTWKFVNKGWRPTRSSGKWMFEPYDDRLDIMYSLETNVLVRPHAVPATSVWRDTVTNLEAKVEKAERKGGNALAVTLKNIDFFKMKAENAEEPLKSAYLEAVFYFDMVRRELEAEEAK